MRQFLGLILVVCLLSVASCGDSTPKNDIKEVRRAEAVKRFQEDRNGVLAELKKLINEKKYSPALYRLDYLTAFQDPELDALRMQAKAGVEQEKAAKENVAKSSAKYWEHVRSIRFDQFVVVDKSKEADERVYLEAARALCIPGKHCFIHFWSDRRHVPVGYPMTDTQANAVVASYTKNPTNGFEQLLLNCRIKNDSKNCFR